MKHGPTAIITGASGGIGREITRFFLDRDYGVMIHSSDEEKLRAFYEELGRPENLGYIPGDIAEKYTARKLVGQTLERFGSVDTLINNAGIFTPKPFLEVEERELDRFWSVNLKGTFFACQAAIPEMINRGGGSIVNMGTVLVAHTIADFPTSAPAVSKGAIHTLSRHLAAEFGRYNIRVNTLAPGIIRSPMLERNGVKDPDSLAGLHLLNRIGEPEEIAAAAFYLATNGFVTGETLNVAGGHTAGHYINGSEPFKSMSQ